MVSGVGRTGLAVGCWEDDHAQRPRCEPEPPFGSRPCGAAYQRRPAQISPSGASSG